MAGSTSRYSKAGLRMADEPRVDRNRKLILRAGIFLSGNALAQLTGALAGLLLTRWLSTPEYALYTVFAYLTSALTVLSKGGVHLGFTALLGRYWPDLDRTSSLINSLMSVRQMLAWTVGPPLMIMAGFLLIRNGADALQVGAFLVFLAIFWGADIMTRVIDQILYFANQAGQTQVLDAVLNFARVMAVVGLFFAHWLNALTAAFLVTGMAALRIAPITRWIERIIEGRQVQAVPADVSELKAVTIRQMPVEIYFVAQAPLVLICLSLFGDVESVASFGALTRLAMLLAPAQAFGLAFCTPILAGARRGILRTYLVLVLVCAVPSIALVLAALVVPHALLWIVGPNYADQIAAVRVCALTSGFTSVVGAAWSLAAHRGWNHWTQLQIPVGIIWGIAATQFLDLGTVVGGLWLTGGFSIGLLAATIADLVRAHRTGVLA